MFRGRLEQLGGQLHVLPGSAIEQVRMALAASLATEVGLLHLALGAQQAQTSECEAGVGV